MTYGFMLIDVNILISNRDDPIETALYRLITLYSTGTFVILLLWMPLMVIDYLQLFGLHYIKSEH